MRGPWTRRRLLFALLRIYASAFLPKMFSPRWRRDVEEISRPVRPCPDQKFKNSPRRATPCFGKKMKLLHSPTVHSFYILYIHSSRRELSPRFSRKQKGVDSSTTPALARGKLIIFSGGVNSPGAGASRSSSQVAREKRAE